MAYIKKHRPPTNRVLIIQGIQQKQVFCLFVCVCARVRVSLASSLALMGPWSLFYTKATQVDVFLNGLILSPCLMICRVIY